MRISRSQVEAVIRSYMDRTQARSTGSESASRQGGDKVSVSDDARQVDRWVKLARALPDIRSAEFNRLRSELASGTYNPSSEDVAQKILERLLTDRILEERSDHER